MLAENLIALRKSKKITQDELAAHLNVVRQTVSKWEKGDSVPDANLIIVIAKFYEISVDELLGTAIIKKEESKAVQQLSMSHEKPNFVNIQTQMSHRVRVAIAIIIFSGISILFGILLSGNPVLNIEGNNEHLQAETLKEYNIRIPNFVNKGFFEVSINLRYTDSLGNIQEDNGNEIPESYLGTQRSVINISKALLENSEFRIYLMPSEEQQN